MEFDSFCGTELDLGLSLSSPPSNHPCMSLDPFDKGVPALAPSIEPSLTLGLSRNHNRGVVAGVGGDIGTLYQQDNTVVSGGGSSFSNTSSKRKREVGSEEFERVSIDNNYSRVMSATSVDDVEDDDDCADGRKKLRLTKPQSALLEQAFKHHSSLNPKQKQELAKELKLRPRQVEVWFQNRRARTKLKQNEMNFEHLKKRCQKLTEENRRLQKEVQELKGLKSPQPLYMQLPAATLTMCPSCERIGDTKSALVKNPFTVGAKPHFFNSFTNPSAAC